MNKFNLKISIRNTLLAGLAVVSFSSVSIAQPQGGGEGRGGGRGAPQEAIEACSNLSAGDACEFDGRRGSVSGVCFTPSQDSSELACKPSNHDEMKGQGQDRDRDRDREPQD